MNLYNKYINGFFDTRNQDPPELLIAIMPVVLATITIFGIISHVREQDVTNKSSYEVIDFK